MNIPFCELRSGYVKYREEYIEAATRVLDSGWYILGKELETFEREFASWLGTDYCVGLNSGLDALILAFQALGIGHGDEIIVPANTYIASVMGITKNDATPVFIEPDEYHNIDADSIESAITKNTKAILVVHLYGQPCRMDKIMEIANRHGIPVVEDCAQSHGATFNGKMTGTFGKISCFSFFPTKNLGAFGDAGAIATTDKELADKIQIYRNYGSEKKYYNKVQGVNSRLDEMQAALLRVKLTHLEELTLERELIAQKYLNNINNPLIELPKVISNTRPVWHQFVIKTEKRDGLIEYLSDNGIGSQIHYPIPPHLSEAYSSLGFTRGSFPITEKEADTILSIPIYNSLRYKESDHIIKTLNNYKR